MQLSHTFWEVVFGMILGIIGVLIYANGSRFLNREHVHINSPRYAITAGIKTALDHFEIDNGYYPKSLHDLIQKPSSSTNWFGPYFDLPQIPVDPWGHNYIYEFPGKHNPSSYDLMSDGPDGKKGTKDDIGNW